ncbi:MAG: Uma2 family endonuclease [Planctomycetaceae bacterium]|nr:Uma2 family endonuclease [Planctomycetales bacterium]MCB9920592.1 Uma2 family endonuclease [Planctomycetaceae bacterium]
MATDSQNAGTSSTDVALTSSQARMRQADLPSNWTMADLQHHLGDIPAERILVVPPPGYATPDDVDWLDAHEDRLCELEDGVLVEKPMGWYESLLALLIATEINIYLRRNDVGKVLGADGSMKILPGIVKIPDVSFISWERWPKVKMPRRPIPALVPDLVVEVLSDTNTKREMEIKLVRYFESGVRLIWYVDPETRTAKSYTSPSVVTEVNADGSLNGGEVLPGFQLSLAALFGEADRCEPR